MASGCVQRSFWGVILKPDEPHIESKLERPLHVSMATLHIADSDKLKWSGIRGPITVMMHYEGCSYLLCTLNKLANLLQVPLHVEIESGKQVSFSANAVVHLTGHLH